MTFFTVLITAIMLLTPQETGARELQHGSLEFAAIGGIGFYWETAEASPFRCLAGMDLAYEALDLRLLLDCGMPWEPASSLEADLSLLDRRILRIGVNGRAWQRAYGSSAMEFGCGIGARMEIGPRVIAFTAAGGLSVLSTAYDAIGESLPDSNPWAQIGMAFRPFAPACFQLAITSDSQLSLWLRTYFELSGSWELVSGVRIEGSLAACYSDFFTLTSYRDGFQARALVFLPIRERTR